MKIENSNYRWYSRWNTSTFSLNGNMFLSSAFWWRYRYLPFFTPWYFKFGTCNFLRTLILALFGGLSILQIQHVKNSQWSLHTHTSSPFFVVLDYSSLIAILLYLITLTWLLFLLDLNTSNLIPAIFFAPQYFKLNTWSFLWTWLLPNL